MHPVKVMSSYPGTWARVLLLFAACMAVIADQPIIIGDEHGYILGWWRNMSCVVMSPLRIKNRDVLVWLLDGKALNASGKDVSKIGNVFVYTSVFILPVTPQLNHKVLTCQNTINPSAVEEIKETIDIIKLVDKPYVTGPSKVVVGLRYTWDCVADGANRGPPDIEWFFGNNTSITNGSLTETNIYNDKDDLLTYNTTSTLVLQTSESDTNFAVYCQAREKSTGSPKVSSPVNIQVIHCNRLKEFLQKGIDMSKIDAIINNGFYEFELSYLEVDEPDDEATRIVSVQVLRQCNSSNNDVVTWEASNKAGTEDLEDYSGSIHFLTGDIRASLKLGIRNDDIPELEETISVWLVNADKGTITSDPEKAKISLKIPANDDPYGLFVLTGPTSTADPNRVQASITRKGGAFGTVEVLYQVTPPVHVSGGPDVTDTNSSGFGRLRFAENERVSNLSLPRHSSKNITVTLLSVLLIASLPETPVPNSPRLGTQNERQITISVKDVDVTKDKNQKDQIKPKYTKDKDKEKEDGKDVKVVDKDEKDGQETVQDDTDEEVVKDKMDRSSDTGLRDYEATPLSTKDILYVILPALFVIFIIMIVSMCCCCEFCGIIRKACRVGDEKKCICCGRVCCFCTPIYGVLDDDNAELTKSETEVTSGN